MNVEALCNGRISVEYECWESAAFEVEGILGEDEKDVVHPQCKEKKRDCVEGRKEDPAVTGVERSNLFGVECEEDPDVDAELPLKGLAFSV